VVRLTFLFQVDTALRDYNRNVTVDVALPVFVEQRYRNVCIGYALDEGYTEDAWERGLCV
jgi:hypothetical protein